MTEFNSIINSISSLELRIDNIQTQQIKHGLDVKFYLKKTLYARKITRIETEKSS